MRYANISGIQRWTYIGLALLAIVGHIFYAFQPWFVDDIYISDNILHYFSEKTIIPKLTEYPTLASYLGAPFMAIGVALHSLLTNTSIQETTAYLNYLQPESLVFPVRLMSLTALGLAALILAKYVQQRYSNATALIIGLLFFSQQVFIERSAYAVPDIMLLFISSACSIFILEAIENRQNSNVFFEKIAISSLLCGLTVSTKYNGAALAFPIAIAVAIHSTHTNKPIKRLFHVGGISLLCFFLGVIFGSPAWLIEPSIMMEGINFQINLAQKGHLGSSGIPLIAPIAGVISESPVLSILAAIGLFFVWKTDKPIFIISITAVCAMLLLSTRTAVQNVHYLYPTYGFIAVLAAATIEQIRNRNSRWTLVISYAYLTIVVISQLINGIGFLGDDSREMARSWIYRHIHQGSVIAVEPMYMPRLFTIDEIESKDTYLTKHNSIRTALQTGHKPYVIEKITHDPVWLKETTAHYFMTNSRMYDRYFHLGRFIGVEPDRSTKLGKEFYKRREFYSSLFNNSEFVVLASFDATLNETITIFRKR